MHTKLESTFTPTLITQFFFMFIVNPKKSVVGFKSPVQQQKFLLSEKKRALKIFSPRTWWTIKFFDYRYLLRYLLTSSTRQSFFLCTKGHCISSVSFAIIFVHSSKLFKNSKMNFVYFTQWRLLVYDLLKR